MSIGEREMRHDLLVYDSDDGFARYVALFAEEAIEAGQPMVVVTSARMEGVLRGTLSGADAEAVTFVDRDRFYTRPEAVLAAYDAQLRALLSDGAEAVRAYGELPLCADAEEWNSWLRYEAVLNRAFAGQPVWVTCGYDSRLLPPEVVDGAWRMHRDVHAHGWCENPHYEDPADVARSLTPEPELLPGLRTLPLVQDERAFRELLGAEMERDGVDADTAADLLVASIEVLANARRHGGGLRSLRAGRAGDRFVCEIADSGPGLDDPFAGYVPPRPPTDQAGLWIARQLTSRLDLLSSAAGLTVVLWA